MTMSADQRADQIRDRLKNRKIRAYCSQCGHRQTFKPVKVNHWLHLLLSILTCGLWLISWAAICAGILRYPWRCKHCGWHKPQYPG